MVSERKLVKRLVLKRFQGTVDLIMHFSGLIRKIYSIQQNSTAKPHQLYIGANNLAPLFLVSTYTKNHKITIMKKLMYLLALCLFVSIVATTSLKAQEKEAPVMYYVIEEFVEPAQFSEFWKVQSEALKVFDELDSDMAFSCYRTDQNSYYWVLPIENFAGIDKLYAKMASNHKALEEKGYNSDEKFRDLSTMSQFVVTWNPELSYTPEPKNEAAPEHTFHKWLFAYIKSGHEKEAGAAIKAYQKFYESVDDTYSWNIFQLALGNSTPCWIMHVSAESEIAMLQKEKDLGDKYKKDFQRLWGEYVAHVRDLKPVKGWYVPDWSRNE